MYACANCTGVLTPRPPPPGALLWLVCRACGWYWGVRVPGKKRKRTGGPRPHRVIRDEIAGVKHP